MKLDDAIVFARVLLDARQREGLPDLPNHAEKVVRALMSQPSRGPRPEAAIVINDLRRAAERIDRLGLADHPDIERAIARAERELERLARPRRLH